MKKYDYSEFAAVDIGGTNTRIGFFNDKGEIIKKEKTNTDYNFAESTLKWVVDKINQYEIKYLALCIPGPSDYEQGKVLKSPNLGGTWENFDVKNYLLKNSNLIDILFENDANAMAYSNHKAHNLKNNEISQFFTISTGFGAGLIIDGKIFHGNKYYAQEIAQLPISEKPFLGDHRLKNPFALELHCSGSGIETKSKFFKLSNSSGETFKLASEGNALALKIIQEAKVSLARMFSISAAMIAPNYFFIGGSLALNQKTFVLEAFELAKKYSDLNHFNDTKLIFDKSGDDSALFGLYHLIKDKNI
ncbi:ROK family protein [Mycoplasma buteonis]|uniref:ROK family protein n=1 Tax=Mycoplasma buteonis TaxID=171280 RepID=UPI00055C71C1|nr:ROK family protein [Mycoplasma buteonis]